MGKISSIVLIAATLHPLCQAEPYQGLDIALVADSSSIAPGSTFTVGLHIQHHKGFHTYWKNPGIVGMATAMEWQLPPGFKASKILWPYPELTRMAGHPCHGYERDVTLCVQITAPETISSNMVTLTAKTRWMSCAKDCFPGFKDFTITLPVTAKQSPNKITSPLFQQAQDEMPQRPAPWLAKLVSEADQATVKLELTPKQEDTPSPEYLFSEDGQISSDQQQKFIRQPNGSFLLTVARSEFSPEGQPKLPAVIKVGKSHYFISPSYPKTIKQQP